MTLPTFTLEQADGLIAVRTSPAGAGVTLDGVFQGESPIELAVKSSTRYRIQVFKAGYQPVERTLSVASGEEKDVVLSLRRQMGDVVVTVDPAAALLYINGESRGNANQKITLPTEPHDLSIRLEGYAGYDTEITPKSGLTQEVKVRLMTLEEARLAALKPPKGPGTGLRERLYYLGTEEVTNAEFQAFASGHDSGEFEDQALNKPEQPVVNVSWNDAALYCNWLSDRDGLPRFYLTEFGKVTGIKAQATGYRLPTEAEWAYAVRQVKAEGPLRFAWGGNLPPPDRHGNYADRSAAHLVGRIIFGYNDNYIASAPVGTYPANELGLFDMSGNVAEWTNDFYEIPGPEAVVDPLGPDEGEYRVIRGSSWMHGTITDLRLSFRDYGIDGRQDLGFRLARFAESQ